MKQKPLEVAAHDFKAALISLINGANLPPFVIASELRLVLTEIDGIATRQYEAALADYNKPEETKEEKADG